jgi:hypothetical protein
VRAALPALRHFVIVALQEFNLVAFRGFAGTVMISQKDELQQGG